MGSMIKKVCVIGAGTMGSGIAAQVANAGLEVLMLDVCSDGSNRNIVAESSLERIRKTNPPLLMSPGNIKKIQVGNIDDDLDKIKDCDWVVEAIVERLEIKKSLYRSLLPHLKKNALVSSNTSTIPISLLMDGLPDSLKKQFCITHFFNPVRYMRLLELVSGHETDLSVMDILADFCDRRLGKGVVRCRDTPGFLGNRVGVFAMQAAIFEATELGLSVEEADAIFGRPMGIPKTGAFGLYDLIGVDLMADVVRSLRSILPPDDDFHAISGENDLINSQIEKGFIGNKGKGGFYKFDDGRKYSLDLNSGKWNATATQVPELSRRGEVDGISALIEGDDKLSQFAWNVLARIFTYSAGLIPVVTRSPQDIDDAMKLGYNWVHGPFEMMDLLGTSLIVEKMEKEGWDIPPFLREAAGESFYKVQDGALNIRNWNGQYTPVKLPKGVVRFHLLRRILDPVFENESASLFHLDSGVRLVEFHSKANALDAASMEIVAMAGSDPGPGIIVHNDAQHFSAGVNLERFLEMIRNEDWGGIDSFLIEFQNGCAALKYCDAPVVGAPSGLAVGGGYEVLAHCDKVVAHANTIFGLVETVVGLVPGGGGVKETYWRWFQRTGDWEKAAFNTFNQIGAGRTGSSPKLAANLEYFVLGRDVEVMNRDRLLDAAQKSIQELSKNYSPRRKPKFTLAGGGVYEQMMLQLEEGRNKGIYFSHDVTVASAVAKIVTGGRGGKKQEVCEADMLRFERENFIDLAKTPDTLARIVAMLDGKGALRN